jgi:hypothetical protein
MVDPDYLMAAGSYQCERGNLGVAIRREDGDGEFYAHQFDLGFRKAG